MTIAKPTAILHTSDRDFARDMLQSDRPVMVDFWAEWRGPCKTIAPPLEDIAADHAGRLRVVKLDVDANPDTPAQYRVRGIPTLMLFKGGAVAATQVGALSRAQLRAFLDAHTRP